MEALFLQLEHAFVTIVQSVATIIEFIGLIVIVIAVGRTVYNLIFLEKFNFELAEKDTILNSGLTTALEIFLAGEILMTLVADNLEKLMHVGMLVLIRIVIAVIIHWESSLKASEEHKILENSTLSEDIKSKIIKHDEN